MADPGTIASYVGMGVQALSSGIGGLFTNNAIKKENQKNRDWNEKMWNLTNQWNSPVNQRRLYEEAGLNPALLYGSNTSALSSYSGNLGTSENFKNPLENLNIGQGIIQAKQLQNETELKDSQKEVNASQTNLNDANALKASADAEVERLTAEFKKTENKYQESQIILDMAKKGLENSALELANQYAKEANPTQLLILKETLGKAVADREISEHTSELITKQIETQEAITRRTDAETALTYEKQRTEQTAQASNIASASASYASAGYYSAQTVTENALRPAVLDQALATGENLWRDLRKKDVEIFKTETEVQKMVIDGIIAIANNDRENYKTYVVEKFGNNAGLALLNRVDHIAQEYGHSNLIKKLSGKTTSTYNPTPTTIKKPYVPKTNFTKKFFKWNKK